MNKRILMYAIGVGCALAISDSVLASVHRPIGQQSKESVRALKEKHKEKLLQKAAQEEVARIEQEQLAAGKIEQLTTDAESAVGSDGVARLSSSPLVSAASVTGAAAASAGGLIPFTNYTSQAADFQNNVLTYLKAHPDALRAGNAGIQPIVNAATTAVTDPANSSLLLLNAIKAAVTGKNTKGGVGGIEGALTVDALQTPQLKKAGVTAALAATIVADVAAAVTIPVAGTLPTHEIHEDCAAAAAAFGITWVATKGWTVTRKLEFAHVADTADVLHFHQGDFNERTGFFVGLDEAGDYSNLSSGNKSYALSNVRLGAGAPTIIPLAPAQVTLNQKESQGNPIHGQGLTHLLVAANDSPVVVTAQDQRNVHVVADVYEGSAVWTTQNKDLDPAVKFPLKAADGSDDVAKIFDIAASSKPVKYFKTAYAGEKDRNIIFAAVADKPDLSQADKAKVGIAAIVQEEVDQYLRPLKTGETNLATDGDAQANKALRIDLAAGKAVAVVHDATWAKPVGGANQTDINLWWDDKTKRLFGTAAGLKPGAAVGDAAVGLFQASFDGDALKLSNVAPLVANGLDATPQAGIYGAKNIGAADSATINLYRPRTMHTSTGKDLLLVSGGVSTDKFLASKAWVNALPITADGTLAQKDGVTDAADHTKTPRVDRQKAAVIDVIDEYTPYIVGRSPAYLAPVSGNTLTTNKPVGKEPEVYLQGATLSQGTVLKPDSELKGELHFQGDGGIIKFATNSTIPATSQLKADGVLIDSNLELGLDSEIGANSMFRQDTDLVTGKLKVTKGQFAVAPRTQLAAGSFVKDFTVGKAYKDIKAAADAVATTARKVAIAAVKKFPGYYSKHDGLLDAMGNADDVNITKQARAQELKLLSPAVISAVKNAPLAGGKDAYESIIQAMGVNEKMSEVVWNARDAKTVALAQAVFNKDYMPGRTSFAGDAMAKTLFPAGSKLAKDSILKQGSQINQGDIKTMTLGVGGVVIFDTTKENTISPEAVAVTDLALTAGDKPAGLHTAGDNPVRNALATLKAGTDFFAKNPAGVANQLTAQVQDPGVLGLAKDVSSKNALRTMATGDAFGQALHGLNKAAAGTFKEAVANLSARLTQELAGHKVAPGVAVVDAMMQQAKQTDKQRSILGAGLEKAADSLMKQPEFAYLPQALARVKDEKLPFNSLLKNLVWDEIAGGGSVEQSLVKNMTQSLVTKNPADAAGKRKLVAFGVRDAYQGAGDPVGDCLSAAVDRFWPEPSTTGVLLPNIYTSEKRATDGCLEKIKEAIPAGYDKAAAVDTHQFKMTTVYDETKVLAPADRKALLVNFLTKAKEQYSLGKSPEIYKRLTVLDAAANQLQVDALAKKIVQATTSAYLNSDGPVVPATHKGFVNAFTQEGAGGPQLFAKAIIEGKDADKGFSAYKNDTGFKAVIAASEKLSLDNGFLYNKLPGEAVNALFDDALIGPEPAAGKEFFADRAALTFQPHDTIELDDSWRIGAGSELSGIMVAEGKTWEFGAGTKLAGDTQFPAWTLFRKGIETDYWNAPDGIQAADGFNAPVDADTPFGGQWMVGKIADFTQAERGKLAVQNNLELKKLSSTVKIAGDRKIASDLKAATPAIDKFVVTIPGDTVLPAGTKVYNDSGKDFTNNVGAGDLNFAVTKLDSGQNKVLTDNCTVNAGWTLPDGISVEYPQYPTKLAAASVLPAGTMIQGTAVTGDISASIVMANPPGTPFKKSDGTDALNFAADGTYVLPASAKIVGDIDTTAQALTITNDPLFTPGIIQGSFIPFSGIAKPYTPPAGNVISLKKEFVQKLAIDSVIKQGVDLKPALIEVVGDKATTYARPFTAYAINSTTPATLAKETVLQNATKFFEQKIVPDGAAVIFDHTWMVNATAERPMILPAGAVLKITKNNQDLTAKILDHTGTAIGPNAAKAEIKVPDEKQYKIVDDLPQDGNIEYTITVPDGKALEGGIFSNANGVSPLNADLKVSAANEHSAGFTIGFGSVLAPRSNLQTGFMVDGPAKGLNVGGVDDANLKILNAGGKVTVLDANNPLKLAKNPTSDGFTKVDVGLAPLKLEADVPVAAGKEVYVAGMSTLGVGTYFPAAGVNLGAPLIMNHPTADDKPSVADALGVDFVVNTGSKISKDSLVGRGGSLKVIDAAVSITPDNSLLLSNSKFDGDSKAKADSTFKIENEFGKLSLSSLKKLKVTNGDINIGANAQLAVGPGGSVTLVENSTIGAGSYTVSADSAYATSATDMQVIGDTVYVALEGDRNTENGVEAGVFKSTAVFNEKGVVRGWTPWMRVGAGTDAVGFFGHSEVRGDLVYLTSPDGKAYVDQATNSLINPATTIKMTAWGDSAATSLSAVVAPHFLTADPIKSGVSGVFDFGCDTRGFKNPEHRYEDPSFSMMALTGYDRVSLAQTGAYDGAGLKTFVPTQNFAVDSNVFNFGPEDGLKGLDLITCAELTRKNADANANWMFVGGNGGLAVLVKKDGSGEGYGKNIEALRKTPAPNVFDPKAYTFLKLSAQAAGIAGGAELLKHVRKIVADEATGYVYVVTKDVVLRINPTAAAFASGGREGFLAAGALDVADKDFVVLADVALSKYHGDPANALLTGKSVVDAAHNAEFTDLMILQSRDEGALETKVLLATTNGLVVSDNIAKNQPTTAPDVEGITWNKVANNVRDAAGDADKKAAWLGAALRLQPVSLQPSGRMVVDEKTHTHTYEGNVHVLATNKDAKALRQYRFNATGGELKPIAEVTGKDTAGAAVPYFVEYGELEPRLIDDGNQWYAEDSVNYAPDLETSFFQQRNQAGLSEVAELPTQQMIADAITAAGVGAAADVYFNLEQPFYGQIYLPAESQVVNSASGALCLPSSSGLLVNE